MEQNVPELVAARPPRDDETMILIQKYLTNNNYRSLIAVSLIFMFSLVFYLIYLLVDAFIDKEKHYDLCVKSFERYEKRCRAKAKLRAKQQEKLPEDEQPAVENNKLGADENPKEIGLKTNSFLVMIIFV